MHFNKSFLVALLLTAFLASLAVAGEKYTLDKSHSSAGFSVRHLVISKTSGKFNEVDGVFWVNEEDITKSSAEFTIQIASIDTDDEKRDGHLKSPDFFNAEKYPTIKFKSSSFAKTEDGYQITGDLTIKDVTKEVSFPFDFNGFVEFMGTKRFGAEARLTINRQDFHVEWNKTLDNGGLVVGNDVDITLQIEGIKAKEGTN